jgi:hypothetical protein
MRLPVVIAFVFSAATAFGQAGLWSHVSAQAGPQRLEPASLSDVRLKAVGDLIRHQKPDTIWECEGPDLDEAIKGLRFEAIPMPGKQEVVLAEAPAGCARGGQGANGAMWVIRFDGVKATLLATPQEFSGWLFSVQTTMSHGYPDLITGWHMSAGEAGLSYLRFDGTRYRSIGAATLESDEDGNEKIVSKSK